MVKGKQIIKVTDAHLTTTDVANAPAGTLGAFLKTQVVDAAITVEQQLTSLQNESNANQQGLASLQDRLTTDENAVGQQLANLVNQNNSLSQEVSSLQDVTNTQGQHLDALQAELNGDENSVGQQLGALQNAVNTVGQHVDALQAELNGDENSVNQALTNLQSQVSNHENDTSNPHQVDKAQVGLAKADDTADAEKPVSGPQQAALDEKVDKVAGSGLVADIEKDAWNAKATTNTIIDDNASDTIVWPWGYDTNNLILTTAGEITVANPEGMTAGQHGKLIVILGGDDHTVTFGDIYRFPEGITPSLPGGVDPPTFLSFVLFFDGTHVHIQYESRVPIINYTTTPSLDPSRYRLSSIQAVGGGSLAVNQIGYDSPTIIGNPEKRPFDPQDLTHAQQRVGYVSDSAPGSSAGIQLTNGNHVFGTSFQAVFVWGASDDVAPEAARVFVGFTSATDAPGDDPTKQPHVIGVYVDREPGEFVGHLSMIAGDGQSVGAVFGGDDWIMDSKNYFKMVLTFSPDWVLCQLTNGRTGATVTEGMNTDGLPKPGTPLTAWIWRNNGEVKQPVSVDFMYFNSRSLY